MTTLTPKLIQQISKLSPDQQTALSSYLHNHLDQILAAAEKEYRVATGTYTLDDFNEETQAAIRDIENGENLIVCEDVDDLYKKLGI